MGRTTDYTPELANLICERIASGESLREICKPEDFPDKSTVFRWIASNNEFRDQYARAKEAQAEAFADELLDIADDGTNDWMARNGEDNAGWVANGEHIQRSKLRVDTRKWVMSKLLARKYGDKLDLNHGGGLEISVKRVVTDL